jgi:Kef-type K+ transport system membrane component KefB
MTTDLGIIGSAGIMIVAAALMMLLARRLRIPGIVTYIVTGLLLGPVGLNLLSIQLTTDGHGAETAIAVIAELGIVLLLFLVGLELSLDKIRAVGKVAVSAGIGQVIFTAVIGFGVALLLGFNTMESIFLATALTFSSTVVVVKLLDQKKHLNLLYGRIAVGIFLVQDLIVIIVLTFLAGLGDPESANALTIRGLGRAFLGMGSCWPLPSSPPATCWSGPWPGRPVPARPPHLESGLVLRLCRRLRNAVAFA